MTTSVESDENYRMLGIEWAIDLVVSEVEKLILADLPSTALCDAPPLARWLERVVMVDPSMLIDVDSLGRPVRIMDVVVEAGPLAVKRGDQVIVRQYSLTTVWRVDYVQLESLDLQPQGCYLRYTLAEVT